MMDIPYQFELLLQSDTRYKREAYGFIREALQYAQDSMFPDAEPAEEGEERHLTGQQLCEAIRHFSRSQYGMMAKMVLNDWGITKTDDFGEIVYNLIEIGLMKKSDSDCKEDFNGAYDFQTAFIDDYQIEYTGEL